MLLLTGGIIPTPGAQAKHAVLCPATRSVVIVPPLVKVFYHANSPMAKVIIIPTTEDAVNGKNNRDSVIRFNFAQV